MKIRGGSATALCQCRRCEGVRWSLERQIATHPRSSTAPITRPRMEAAMKRICFIRLFALGTTALSLAALGHSEDAGKAAKGEKLGRVLFKTTCTPQAQKQ